MGKVLGVNRYNGLVAFVSGYTGRVYSRSFNSLASKNLCLDFNEVQRGQRAYPDIDESYYTDPQIEFSLQLDLSQTHITGKSQPDKSIDAMDEAGSLVRVSHIHESIPVLLHHAAAKAHP